MRLRRWTAGGLAACATCAAVALGLLLVIASAAAAPSGRTGAPCLAHGARYVVHHLGGDQVTTTYTVTEVRGVSCAFASKWVGRLTHKRAKHYALFKGVPGWYCGSFAPNGLVSAGDCTKTGGHFKWQPKLPPPPSNLRLYDITIDASGTATTGNPSEAVSAHWTQTAPGFRMHIHWQKIHHTILAELYADEGRGSGTITIDLGPDAAAAFGCPEHASYQVPLKVSDGFDNPPVVSQLSLVDEITGNQLDCVGVGGIHGSGPHIPCVDAGLRYFCWSGGVSTTDFVFPTFRVRSNPFQFPIKQIVAHQAFARTYSYDEPPPAFGYASHMTLRVTFTPRH